jgi:flagellar hook assembly protein FlgD
MVSPNPAWGGRAEVRFELAAPRAVRVTIHDVSGRRVATLASGPRGGGPHVLRWNGRDSVGRDMPAGVYFARLSAVGLDRVVRFAILR